MSHIVHIYGIARPVDDEQRERNRRIINRKINNWRKRLGLPPHDFGDD